MLQTGPHFSLCLSIFHEYSSLTVTIIWFSICTSFLSTLSTEIYVIGMLDTGDTDSVLE